MRHVLLALISCALFAQNVDPNLSAIRQQWQAEDDARSRSRMEMLISYYESLEKLPAELIEGNDLRESQQKYNTALKRMIKDRSLIAEEMASAARNPKHIDWRSFNDLLTRYQVSHLEVHGKAAMPPKAAAADLVSAEPQPAPKPKKKMTAVLADGTVVEYDQNK